jgi:hypothetical protein
VDNVKSLRGLIVAALLVSGIVGCYGTESGQKQITDQSKIGQIQKGVSTKASIRAAFGAPEGTDYAANGDEVWTYSYVNASMDPASYIPVVGMFAFGGTTQTSALTVSFDNRGVVRAYSVDNSGTTTGRGKM